MCKDFKLISLGQLAPLDTFIALGTMHHDSKVIPKEIKTFDGWGFNFFG